ncbi:hypothetical protein, partial [Phocoenobacter skyensis]
LYEELEDYQWQELSNEKYQEILSYETATYQNGVIKGIAPRPSQCHELINGKWVLSQEKVKESFKRNQQALIITLKNKADELNDNVLYEYPQVERETFKEQAEEAFAYKQDKSANTKRLTKIAKDRGLTLDEIVNRVIRKYNIYDDVRDGIIAKRQVLMDRIEVATTQNELNAINKEIEQWQLSI